MQGMRRSFVADFTGGENRFPAGKIPEMELLVMGVYTVDEVGEYLSWRFWQGRPPVNLGDTVTVDLTGLDTASRSLARMAMEAWSELGLRFQSATGDVDIVMTDNVSGAFAVWDRPKAGNWYPSVNVGPDFGDAFGVRFGSYTYQAWIHEIGHALGLGHAGQYNFTADYGVDNSYDNDSWQMSVMSYFSQDDNPTIDASLAYVLTPMPGDIAAIQRRYGFENDANAGNTTYFWDTDAAGIHGRIGRKIADGGLAGQPFTLTIMDGSGVDTLNFRGERAAIDIDLAPGSVNSAFGLRGNLLIERTTVIENVIGTSRNDIIRGQGADNQLTGNGGHDYLRGGNGNDRLFGGTGDDQLFGDSGDDRLTGGRGDDLLDGGTGWDTVYFSATVHADLIRPANNAGEADGDRLVKIENLVGGKSNDKLSGNDIRNELNGGSGNDTLRGRGSNDRLDGSAGDDVLVGGNGDDKLNGGAGNDVLRGGTGHDRLIGLNGDDRIYVNSGKDTVTGGVGADSFIFQGGRMIIQDFTDNRDELVLDRAMLGLVNQTVDEILDGVRYLRGDMLLELADATYVRIVGMTNADLLADDLILV